MKIDMIQGIFDFDPNDRIYADHFPGNPVVPGSLIVAAFFQALQQAGWTDQVTGLENFRFKKWVAPGKYNYRIYKPENQTRSITCELVKNNQILVKGVVGK